MPTCCTGERERCNSFNLSTALAVVRSIPVLPLPLRTGSNTTSVCVSSAQWRRAATYPQTGWVARTTRCINDEAIHWYSRFWNGEQAGSVLALVDQCCEIQLPRCLQHRAAKPTVLGWQWCGLVISPPVWESGACRGILRAPLRETQQRCQGIFGGLGIVQTGDHNDRRHMEYGGRSIYISRRQIQSHTKLQRNRLGSSQFIPKDKPICFNFIWPRGRKYLLPQSTDTSQRGI